MKKKEYGEEFSNVIAATIMLIRNVILFIKMSITELYG